ncbi:Aldolase superfamily protein [Arabidopsis thaliana]|uniref:transaldolase n=2 Tax=Arabidopsis thaliana TaxID=3702 RepID=F4IC59_ARATH|nr:Aldolase superfamily protein [Arabidopsis thaliana]AEE28854.1 Aldolase superfamily protein [Arabidopsis thaliana]|eukprot:NP_001184971.1 Aldolase superfamily protein [Arabidopsis thaliana]
MPLSLQSPPCATLSASIRKGRWKTLAAGFSVTPLPAVNFSLRRSIPRILASASSSSSPASSSLEAGENNELNAVSAFSEIVPDTVVFDDFESFSLDRGYKKEISLRCKNSLPHKFPPTAATVSSALLLGICGLPDTIFRNAVDMALADSSCAGLETTESRLSCFFNKAIVNVGGDLVKLVPGRVSTEVDARLAYDTNGIIRKVHDLLRLYNEIDVPHDRLLFKIPATWQGIEAARLLESEGIQTHMTFVYSFAQAAAASQAGASVIQIFVGRLRDWARNHSGDTEIESAIKSGEDPGLALVKRSYNYIHKYGYKSKLMAAAVRNKQDLFSLLGVDYVIAPLKVLQSLKDSPAIPDDEKYSFVRKLTPETATHYHFTNKELVKWDQLSLASSMGPASVELLSAGVEGYANQAKRVEELFGKIWPPPNV